MYSSNLESNCTWEVDEADVIVNVVPAPGLVDNDAAVSRALEKFWIGLEVEQYLDSLIFH